MTEETKRKSETIERIATKLSILAILGGAIAAINHYAGYSFLKGVIEAIGLGNSSVELSNQETTHMTMIAIRSAYENWMAEVAKFFKIGWIGVSLLCVLMAFYGYFIFDFKLVNRDGSTPNKVLYYFRKLPVFLKKMFTYPFFAFFGLIIYMVSVSFLLWIVWGALSVFYSVGYSYGKDMIQSGICAPLDVIRKKEERDKEYNMISGCSIYIDAYGNQLHGRIVFSGKNNSIFITNTESIIFDTKGKHLACSPRYDLNKDDDKQAKNHCVFPVKKSITPDK
ncbi:hypothetical protein R0J93_07275 [Pseudoalteromonas sp. SIMBA_148]